MARELIDEMITLIHSESNNNPAPKPCKIVKNYGDTPFCDVEVEDLGILIYKKTIGSTEIGSEGIICFLNGDLNQGIVITSDNIVKYLVDYVKNDDYRLSDARPPTSHNHSKSEIIDFPTIPTKTSQLTNDNGFTTDEATFEYLKKYVGEWNPILNGETGAIKQHSYSESNGEAIGKGFLLNHGFLNTDNWELSFEFKHDNIRYTGINFIAMLGTSPNGSNRLGTWEGSWPGGTAYATYNSGEVGWFDVTVTKIDSTHVRLQSKVLNRDTNVEVSWLPNATFLTCGARHNTDSSFGPCRIRNVNVVRYVPKILDLVYPVGSIYMSVNDVNPEIIFGGTWEQIKDTFLLASGNNYPADPSTANTAQHGSADAVVVSHNHTQNSHNHTQNAHKHGTGDTSANKFLISNKNIAVNSTHRAFPASGSAGYIVYASESGTGIGEAVGTANATATNNGTTATNNETGVSGTGKNMPPYLTVYMWKRTG